ncbi:hypothetical protein E8E13_002691 [Curvularia kusanoi]|uniref:Uncharacterized protein n=1 Tax=Curvularia kusanoi TaxID=90978 RepID=A0A9P4T3N5_CURKU|nr:hypothetical protein E8E13_002691 [Curvularia kusanoi]
MPRGSVSQVLKIATLPEGVKMTITNVSFNIPSGNNSWWPTFAGITKNSSPNDKKNTFPFEVSPTINHGRIGEVGLTSLSVFDSGEGPSASIEFTLSGGVFSKRAQKGSITVATSEWGSWTSLWGNANQVVLAYGFSDCPIVTKTIDIAVSGHTQELNLEVALDKEGQKPAMRWGRETSLAFDAANLLLSGVYYVHEKGYEWALGAVGI